MINALSSQGGREYDAVVGDITISAARSENWSFTQPYLNAGIAILAPAASLGFSLGVFLKPFTAATWGLIALSPVLAGVALWLLDQHPHSYYNMQADQPRLELFTKAFWSVTSMLAFFKREPIENPSAKCVMIAWIVFILLLGCCYTASLSSILTVNVLTSSTITFDEVRSKNLTVGYQLGSIVKDYLTVRQNLPETNLVPMHTTDDYSNALSKGTVAVIVDEIPYISLFLAAQSASDCRFSVSSKLTIEGFGYAFGNGDLAATFSVAMLNLSESGEVQRLQDSWKLGNFQCPSHLDSTQLDLNNSEGLFILLGSATFACIVIFVPKVGIPYSKRYLCKRYERQDIVDAHTEPIIMHVSSMRRWFSRRHHEIRLDEFA